MPGSISDNSANSQFGDQYTTLPGEAPPSLTAPTLGEKPVTKGAAGTATTLGSLTQSSIEEAQQSGALPPSSSAYADPANPKPPLPDAALSENDPALTASPTTGKNAFLGCIYAVALTEIMGEMLKLDMYHERVDSQQWLGLQQEMYDSTMATAAYTLAAGKAEMMGCFAKAVFCAVGAATSIAGGIGSAWKGPRTSIGATIQQGTQAINSLFGSDSVGSNIAAGITAMNRAKYEALQKIQDYYTQLARSMMDRMDSDRKDVSDAKNQMLQSYQQWMNTLSQITQRG